MSEEAGEPVGYVVLHPAGEHWTFFRHPGESLDAPLERARHHVRSGWASSVIRPIGPPVETETTTATDESTVSGTVSPDAPDDTPTDRK